MKVALVLGGDPPSSDEMKLLDACDQVICADGAARALLQAERPPSIIVGDLDSLDADAYKWAEALDIPIERFPPKKDETDGELALAKVFEIGAKSIIILGGHGGRTAMFLANMKLLRRAHDKGLDAVMIGRGESMRFVSPGGELALAGRTGSTLNIIPVDGDVKVSISGTEWEVHETTVPQTSARGVSNKITTDGARVRVHEGTCLVIVERPAEN